MSNCKHNDMTPFSVEATKKETIKRQKMSNFKHNDMTPFSV